MATAPEVRASRVFVILNPVAGTCDAGEVQRVLGQHFPCAEGSCDVHQTTGHENLAALARAAAERIDDVERLEALIGGAVSRFIQRTLRREPVVIAIVVDA